MAMTSRKAHPSTTGIDRIGLAEQIATVLDEAAHACRRAADLRVEAASLLRASELRRRRRIRSRRPGHGGEPATPDLDDLHHRYAECREPELRDRLVHAHAPLAYGLAARFQHRGESLDDLQQVALLALVKSVERFDPQRGLQFSTFATPTVLGELKRHFRDRAWAVRLPRQLHDRYLSVQRARDDLAQELGRSPTLRELSERVGVSMEEVLETIEAGDARTTRSLDAPMPGFDDLDLASLLGTPDERLTGVEQRATLDQLLGRLSVRERDVLRMRFYDGMTQMQIADALGTNQMHVSRLLNRSLQRLRALAA